LEDAVKRAASYRGKVLSLDISDSYSGEGTGLTVHKIAPLAREDVILPAETMALVERNVLGFVEQRGRLMALGQSIKKGLLFYGPPGNGKTYTIRYLIGALRDHTTLLITGAQIAQLTEYMALARLLQPTLVVIEDIDLVAKERVQSGMSCEEPLLNKLLNEMDGLAPDAEIIFLLTTNRPELLEEALASRPGRVDQAILFAAPGMAERAQLASHYAGDVKLSHAVVERIVGSTDGASAAFIKELMRRSLQLHLARTAEAAVDTVDIQEALDELVLNQRPFSARVLGFDVAMPSDGHGAPSLKVEATRPHPHDESRGS
jgi:ATP-dependent 26S proteasome regulatory subunit